MESVPVPPQFLDQSDTIFFSNGEAARKRRRVVTPEATQFQNRQQQQATLFATKSQHNPMMSLSSSLSLFSAGFSGELSAKLGQQKDEIDQFLLEQGEQLRQSMVELRQRQYNTLLRAAVQRLHQKQAEMDRASRRVVDLEAGVTRLQAESTAWRAKAVADQATIVNLQAQLQQAVMGQAQNEECGESPDAESVYADPNRTERLSSCRVCGDRPATVVVLPCRHLSLCLQCESTSAASLACLVCCCHRTGSVQVFLS